MSERRAREMTRAEVDAINAEYDRAHGIVRRWWTPFGSPAAGAAVIVGAVAVYIGLPVLVWVYWAQIVNFTYAVFGLGVIVAAWGFWKSLFT